MSAVSAPEPYLLFAGNAREALTVYQQIFGGTLTLNTFADFGRDDGPSDAIAHGVLVGPVSMFAADAAGDESAFSSTGLMFSLLGSAGAAQLRTWFNSLSDGGSVRAALEERPWGAWDGQVIDRFGLCWLVGFEDPST